MFKCSWAGYRQIGAGYHILKKFTICYNCSR